MKWPMKRPSAPSKPNLCVLGKLSRQATQYPGHDIPMFGAVIAPTAPTAQPRPSSGKAIAPAPSLQFDESEYRSAKAVDAELPGDHA